MLRPFEIYVPDDALDDTRRRLLDIRWSAVLDGDPDRYGASVPELREVLDHWAENYSWREWERKLNAHPHYLAEVDGLDLHFWHVRSTAVDAIPLLLLHGWPGSAVEFWELIGPLVDPQAHGDPAAPSFELIIPELPGFGFSGKPTEPGWGLSRTADAMHTLMHDLLGHTRYAVHGEDWGTLIGARIAKRHPEHVAALQITMPFAMPPADVTGEQEWHDHMYAVTGYDHLQAQVPDALTLGMVDSPLALAAWILEKFRAWSDNDGTLKSAFSLDELVTILNFYWLTSSIITSTRFYREVALEGEEVISSPRAEVPTGVCAFPYEPFASPREWLDSVYDVRRYSTMSRGGHFAAMEEPEAVLSEIRAFFPEYFSEATPEVVPVMGGNQ